MKSTLFFVILAFAYAAAGTFDDKCDALLGEFKASLENNYQTFDTRMQPIAKEVNQFQQSYKAQVAEAIKAVQNGSKKASDLQPELESILRHFYDEVVISTSSLRKAFTDASSEEMERLLQSASNDADLKSSVILLRKEVTLMLQEFSGKVEGVIQTITQQVLDITP